MRTKEEIQAILNANDPYAPTRFRGMSYEQGVDEALQWVLGDIPNDEFSPAENLPE